MNKIDYGEWQNKRREFRKVRERYGFKRQPSSRPRDETERDLLMRADKARMDRWIASGRLTFINPRKVRINLQAH
jgi:hypothetical protein